MSNVKNYTELGISVNATLWPVLAVIAAIAAVVAGAFLIIKNWGPIGEFFKKLWADVSGWIVTAWNNIKNFFAGIWDWLKTFFTNWGPAILAVIAPFIGIPLLISQHWDQIKEFLLGLWEGIKSAANTVWNAIVRSKGKLRIATYISTKWKYNL